MDATATATATMNLQDLKELVEAAKVQLKEAERELERSIQGQELFQFTEEARKKVIEAKTVLCALLRHVNRLRDDGNKIDEPTPQQWRDQCTEIGRYVEPMDWLIVWFSQKK